MERTHICGGCGSREDVGYLVDATIAALHAQLESANVLLYKKNCALGRAETIINDLQSQLTQRTAELEAANQHCEIIKERKAEAYKEVEIQLLAKANLHAELERVRGELAHAKKMEAVQKEVADNQTWHVQKLRTLILALPKVEGEIVAQGGYVKDRNKVYACFGSDADMTAYAAIVQYRQGMEG